MTTQKEHNHNWYVKHAEEVKERSRLWAINNPERAKEHRLRSSRKYEKAHERHKDPVRINRATKWAKEHPERIAEIARKHNYGISSTEYKEKSKKQKNRCALCGKKETHRDHRSGKVRVLSVDHDHETNKVRDLICGNCNRGLGMFKDSIEILLKAVQYLKKHKGINNGTKRKTGNTIT